jgi:1-aminocyclopropane-1-carboxylate deaminase/D-cysteine desulfhydrase-like pyridoxal-dependent ACC family enzyme
MQHEPVSPLQYIPSELLESRAIKLYIKRDDLLHPEVSGNKWRKLKYNLETCVSSGYDHLLTTGGAFSNHLSAAAAACNEREIKSIGVVRTHNLDFDNPTIKYCHEKGMRLELANRGMSKEELVIMAENEGAYWLPEGGSNELGVEGASEVVSEIYQEIQPDYLFVSVGSGGTIAGISRSLPKTCQLCGVSSFHTDRMAMKLENDFDLSQADYVHFDEYAFGGFAKYRPELVDFAMSFFQEFKVPLDPVYTVKTVYAIFDLARRGDIAEGSKVVMIHTGGLQGWKGFQYRFPNMGSLPFSII